MVKIMKVKIRKRTILKLVVLSILFSLFSIYYLKPTVMQYSEELTNTAKHEEKITKVEMPAISICLTPNFKPSVFHKHNITDYIFYQNKYPEVLANKTLKA